MGPNRMKLKDILTTAHHYVEANERRNITQAEMAERMGVSPRAYAEYLRGREPAGMKALVALLKLLPEEQLGEVLREKRKKQTKRDSHVR